MDQSIGYGKDKMPIVHFLDGLRLISSIYLEAFNLPLGVI
jgi:hypothetical protein